MTTAPAETSTTATLAFTAARLVSQVPAPEPAMIAISPREHSIDLQPRVAYFAGPAAVIDALLMWAHHLATVHSVEIVNIAGERLHILISGFTAGAIPVRVYSGFALTPDGASLAIQPEPGETTVISLQELADLASDVRPEGTV